MRKLSIIFSVFLLCSCEHFEQDKKVVEEQVKADSKLVENNITEKIKRATNNVRDGVKRTGERVREWWIVPLPKEVKRGMPPRYCYRVLQDILCYRSPMPGWENKLVAYQGENAPPPPPATMEMLPLRSDYEVSKKDDSAENAKPVFVGMPIDPKDAGEQAKQGETVVIDSTHETLLDSPLAPQL